MKVLQYLDDEAVVQINKIKLYTATSWYIYDKYEYAQSDTRTIYGGLRLTPKFGRSIFMSVILIAIIGDIIDTIVKEVLQYLYEDKSRNSSDIRTIYGGLCLTPNFGRSIFMSIIAIIGDVIPVHWSQFISQNEIGMLPV